MKLIIKWIKKELIKKIWSIINTKKESEKNTNTVGWNKINLSKSHTKNRKEWKRISINYSQTKIFFKNKRYIIIEY